MLNLTAFSIDIIWYNYAPRLLCNNVVLASWVEKNDFFAELWEYGIYQVGCMPMNYWSYNIFFLIYFRKRGIRAFRRKATRMKIESIKLKNFRCFENLELSFHPQLTVIVGKNASGKSTILDAVAIAVGTFPSAFDGMSNIGIKKEHQV